MIGTLPELFSTLQLELSLTEGLRMKSLILLFRVAAYSHQGKSSIRYCFRPISILYKLYAEFLLGVELPARTEVGLGLRIFHGVGLVVHKGTRIGNHCTLRQGVTIGNKGGGGANADQLPVIGNNVEFGANVIVIGKVIVGNNVTLGAGVVVTKDIPENSVVVGSAPRILTRQVY